MTNVNATAYLRIPFNVADPAAIETLRLRMKYDDGFIAYLNGQFVASRNAPVSPAWNLTATAAHPNAEGVTFEEFFASPEVLVAGENILAIHGLNITAADSEDMIDDLVTQPIFGPFRGEPAIDRAAVIDVLVGLSDAAVAHPEIVSADVKKARPVRRAAV